MSSKGYELYYWPGIPGRGEFVRLTLEEAGAEYVDVGRLPESKGGGEAALMKVLDSHSHSELPPFAPPVLKSGKLLIAQTALILQYLGPRHGLVPDDEESRLAAQQLQLTIADLVVEAHDVHHPIGASLYYEDQRVPALERSKLFVGERLPKFLGYFERALTRNKASNGHYFVGDSLSYVDLSMFQVMAGLSYAFPKAMSRLASKTRHLRALADRVAARPRIAAYLASKRRLPFNQHGIFRHYPELDS